MSEFEGPVKKTHRSKPQLKEAVKQSTSKVIINFGQNVNKNDLSSYALKVIEELLLNAQLSSVTISNTFRSLSDQARIMYDNLEAYGVENQKKLYAKAGDLVIDVYEKSKAAGKTSIQIKNDMELKIKEIGPSSVSKHCVDQKVINVFDIAPSSVKDKVAFEKAIKADKRISNFFFPPEDPSYHIEIPIK